MPLAGFVVNRVQREALAEPGAKEEWQAMRQDPARIVAGLGLAGDADLAIRLAENLDRFEAIARMNTTQIERLMRTCPGPYLWRTVPAFDVDVHDLSGLIQINRYLFPLTS
jgi:hypothetical protein